MCAHVSLCIFSGMKDICLNMEMEAKYELIIKGKSGHGEEKGEAVGRG